MTAVSPSCGTRGRRPPRWTRHTAWVASVVLQLAATLGRPESLAGQDAPGASDVAVTITIRADSSRTWQVSERFLLPADSASTGESTGSSHTFQYLARPCATLRDVVLVGGGRIVPLAVTAKGPWRLLADTSGIGGGAGNRIPFELRYRVERDGDDVAIPLVVPARPVPRDANARLGTVLVTALLPDSQARVTFPGFSLREGPYAWRGLFVAVPSLVNVQLAEDARPCGRTLPPGDDGGLSWRFWLLVAILVTWVPVYQWWALRASDGDQ